MTTADRLLLHLARALVRYVPEAQREAQRNGAPPPQELVLISEWLLATVRQGATSDAVCAACADAGHMTSAAPLLTKREVASDLGVSVRQVERLIAASFLVAVSVGGAVRVRRSDLDDYIASLKPTRPRSFRDDLEGKDSA